MNEDQIGNLTTIIKFLVMTVAPYLSLTEAMQNQLIGVIVAVIGFIIAYYDAKYQNTVINSNTSVDCVDNNNNITGDADNNNNITGDADNDNTTTLTENDEIQ